LLETEKKQAIEWEKYL